MDLWYALIGSVITNVCLIYFLLDSWSNEDVLKQKLLKSQEAELKYRKKHLRSLRIELTRLKTGAQ